MQKLKHILIIFLLAVSVHGIAQKEKQVLREGNHAYNGGKTMEAANLYRKSLQKKQNFYKANFNLGDALYKTADLIKSGKIKPPDQRMTPDSAAKLIYDQAAQQFEVVAKSVMNKDTAQKAWHNYGNAKLMQNNYEDAIYGYKHALRMNPKDEDTRYNLAYAQKQLKKQQQQQNKNDQKNKEQNKDGDKKQNKQEEDKQKVNNQNDKEKQEAQQPQMSKEQAEQMLNALKNAEKKMQAQRRKKGEPGQRKKVEKDW